MIEQGQVSTDFNGEPLGNRNRYEVAAALYREVNTSISRYNFFYLMLHCYIKTTFEDSRILNSNQDVYQYVIDFLEKNDDVYDKESLLALAKSKIIETKEDYQQAVDLCEIAVAAGQEAGENLYNVLIESLDTTSQESDDQEDSSLDSPSNVTTTQEESSCNEDTQSPTRKEKKAIDQTERKRRRDEQTERRYEAFRSKKNERLGRVEFKPTLHEEKRPYAIDFKCNIDAVRNAPSFHKLIDAIKNRTNEGHPKILHDKRLKQQISAESQNTIKHLFSRRLTEKHRIIYTYDHDQKKAIIFQVEGHYDD